jgi:anti-anti-sigma regulatory factor
MSDHQSSAVSRKLVFKDNLTAERFKYMRDHIAEALLGSNSVELEFREINKVDEALVRLICGAHRVADSMGKSITLSTVGTRNEVNRLAERTGYATFPCSKRGNGCLYRDNSSGENKE